MGRAARLIRSEDGVTMVEYGLMLALIVVGALVAIAGMGEAANAAFTAVSGVLAG